MRAKLPRGAVTHVPGPKRNACPGTLTSAGLVSLLGAQRMDCIWGVAGWKAEVELMCSRYRRRSDEQKIAEHFRATPTPAELPSRTRTTTSRRRPTNPSFGKAAKRASES